MANNSRKRVFYDDRGRSVVFDGKSVVGRRGSQHWSDSPAYFDHFLYQAGAYTATGPITPDGGLKYTSTGTAVTNPTILAVGVANVTGGAGGVLELTTDDIQNSAEEVAGPLLFEIDVQGPLLFEARLKIGGGASSTEATREAFFGLGDALTYTNGRAYTVTTASAITGTNVPADFTGFAISGVPTSGAGFNTDIDGGGTDGQNVGIIGSNNATDTYAALTFGASGKFVANAAGTTGVVNNVGIFHTYRIEIDVQGTAQFSVDGKLANQMVSTVGARPTIPLAPYFAVVTLTGSGANTQATMDIDYIFCGGSSTWKTGLF